ncbi:hypothetical protein [Chitinophaga sancti]|uniref:Uncharacterized protein n=1 Tax=Chitinophaga sancti TaxID=1004 RepID=A0A1K1S1E7_9BACT|nr:hypothetical protein [Chitinophaga sancti]WQD59749.1 hypothetical protein U0033_17815 [Chitinophaga sancti]WQG88120.1 hypothetical protein SR876_24650 [Chitinophaga sancti]SFW77978.1 hypothetical protein SAMN05661012_04552 [Chitinophaga sancti]
MGVEEIERFKYSYRNDLFIPASENWQGFLFFIACVSTYFFLEIVLLIQLAQHSMKAIHLLLATTVLHISTFKEKKAESVIQKALLPGGDTYSYLNPLLN